MESLWSNKVYDWNTDKPAWLGKMINLFVRTKPRPQQRHRNKGRFHYDPSAKEKKDFLYQVSDRIPKKASISIIDMHFTFCYSRPQNHYRTIKKQRVLKDNIPYYKRSTPDIDNLCKFYMDCLGGHFYVNDSQIASINAVKVYGEEDFVHIKIFYTK